MSSIGDQIHNVVHRGVERLKRLPAQVLQHIPSDQVQLGPQGHDHDVLRLRSVYLQQKSRAEMETRPMTAREAQVQRDREFFHAHRGQLHNGQNWAETLKDTAQLAKTLAQPFTTLQNLVESDAGQALDHFRQNSAQITVDAVHQAGSDFLEAQNDPNKGGRATGKVGANILLAVMPLPIPKLEEVIAIREGNIQHIYP